MKLLTQDRKHLSRIAQSAIRKRIIEGRFTENRTIETSDVLKIRCGAFVSVYINGDLRGCIGTFSDEDPLYINVQNMAISASTTDSRFTPLNKSELDNMHIEISVLSPRKQIFDIEEIILGKHGIYMISGMNRGTLLPQVALNQNWSVEEFLGNCARYKAGIGWDGWKTADLYTYEAIIINSMEYS